MSKEPSVQELIPKSEFMPPRAPEGMKKFTIFRKNDESGVSGTGIVVQGVAFANGKAVIQWIAGPDPGDTQIKDDWEKFLNTHVKSHPANETIITWEDGTQERFAPVEEKSEE